LRPTSGHILVDNQDLSTVSLASYYAHVGYLTQEPSVFDGTIRDNLLYAVPHEVPLEHIRKVLTDAKCEFVFDLADGLDTLI
jgi:ABC-type multidrug transport system fused ATPase/permease subunit